MRRFSSYGPINVELHYHVPRSELVELAYRELIGDTFANGGHYLTVWAPRQRGKTWIMQQVWKRLRTDERFDVAMFAVQTMETSTGVPPTVRYIARRIQTILELPLTPVETVEALELLFTADNLTKPLILIVDEFDSLPSEARHALLAMFRNIYLQRETGKYQLYGVALIGVHAVLGVGSRSGSPFNVQRSIHIPNLTDEEVTSMFQWYERESGQTVNQAVIERIFYETQGQPGLVSWLGELLTETYNEATDQPITMKQFEAVYKRALLALPNNTILNIISKAQQEPHKTTLFKLLGTETKLKFAYDDPHTTYLYLNGVVDMEVVAEGEYYFKFPCPFVQKRLFNYFARELFADVGRLYDPFDDLSDTITETSINLRNLLRRYEKHLAQNGRRLFNDAPRRKNDLRIYEAVYHFNLYMYLQTFLERRGGGIWPEFPTGNGKIDLFIEYQGQRYGIEVKSFADAYQYRHALTQAAQYGHSLGLSEIWLVLFVDTIDEANRQKYELTYADASTGVQVHPQFVQVGSPEPL